MKKYPHYGSDLRPRDVVAKTMKLSILILLALALGACSSNDAATTACNASTNCATCCTQHGASGNASGTVNGVYGCRCYGRN